MTFRQCAVLLAFGLVIGISGCGKEPAARPDEQEKPVLMLFCGAGIQLPVSELVEEFSRSHRCRIDADYAGSEVLLSRIRLKKKGDLYMPGDQSYLDIAAKAGMIESEKVACYFVPAILVAKGNPRRISTLRDLTGAGIRLGLGDSSACAIGRQSRKVFAKNSIPWEDTHLELVAVDDLFGRSAEKIGEQIIAQI